MRKGNVHLLEDRRLRLAFSKGKCFAWLFELSRALEIDPDFLFRRATTPTFKKFLTGDSPEGSLFDFMFIDALLLSISPKQVGSQYRKAFLEYQRRLLAGTEETVWNTWLPEPVLPAVEFYN